MNIELELCGGSTVGYLATSVTKSSAASLLISPTLCSTRTTDTPVDVVFQGGHSQLEDFGVGKHYTLACPGATIRRTEYNTTVVSCVIPAGSRAVQIAMQVANNPVYELDRIIKISSPLFGAPKYISIIDDSTGNLFIDVTNPPGGLSPLQAGSENYATSNRTRLLAMVDYIKNYPGWSCENNQAILYFPNGHYYFQHDLRLWPAIRFVGQSRNGVFLRRPSKSWYVANGFPVEPPGYYYYPMWRHVGSGGTNVWNGMVDSKWGGWENVTFDGAFNTFWPFSPYTLFEQSTTMDLVTKGDPVLTGMNRIILENITFQNELTSYVAHMDNTKSYVYHVAYAPDSVIGKGDYSFVGGNTYARVVDVTGSRQVDFEQNTAVGGHYGDGRWDIELRNITYGSLQIGGAFVAGQQTVNVIDSVGGDFGVIAPKADITFVNVDASITGYADVEYTTLREAKSFLAQNCTFRLFPSGTTAKGLDMRASYYSLPTVFQFENCNFIKSGEWTENTAYALYNFGYYSHGIQNISRYPYHKAIFNDCSFSGFDWVYGSGNGGGEIVFVRPTMTNCKGFINLFGDAGSPVSYTFTNTNVNVANDTITLSVNTLLPGTPVVFMPGSGALPAPFTAFDVAQRIYYIKEKVATNTYTFSSVPFGSVVDITTQGDAVTHTMHLLSRYCCNVTVEGPVTIDSALQYWLHSRGNYSSPVPDNLVLHALTSGGEPTVILPAGILNSTINASIRGFSYSGRRRITATRPPTGNDTGLCFDEWYRTDLSAVTHRVNPVQSFSFTSAQVDTANDLITTTVDLGSDNIVYFVTTGSLPEPLRPNIPYRTVRLSATQFRFRTNLVTTTNYVDLVSGGTGTHTVVRAYNTNVGYERADKTIQATVWTAV